MKVEPPALRIRFGVFEADLRSGELRRQGVKVKLQEQPFQALAILLERPGEVVTREELQKRLWPTDTFVDFDRGLNKAIKKLRDALGDSAESPRFIETLPQRGYRLIAPVECNSTGSVPLSGQGSHPRQASWGRPWFLALTVSVGIAAVCLVLVLGLNAGGIRERLLMGRSQQRIWSIAVLPFENLSGDAAQEYFAAGITEELIGELARIGSGVRVISRTSSMQFKGAHKSLPAIAHQLGADAVVEGTALRDGNRVRVTAQLIDARHDVHLWSGKYERDLSDILILQGEVAQAIAGQISVRLAPPKQAVFARSRRLNPRAFEAFLSGAFLFDRPTEPRLSQAIELFTEAIRLDPAYARAYAGIARAHVFMGIFRFRPPSEAFASARAAAGKALELDETLAEAHTVLAETKKNDSDWAGAEAAYRRALELNPSYSLAHTWYAECLSRMGRHEEAIAEANRGRELDPVSMISNTALGMILCRSRRYGEAIQACQRALDLGPHPNAMWFQALAHQQRGELSEAIAKLTGAVSISDAPMFRAALGHAHALAGDRARARAILQELSAPSKKPYVAAANIALIHLGLGDQESAFQWLERAYREDKASIHMLTWPYFDGLRSDPRCRELLRRVGLQP